MGTVNKIKSKSEQDLKIVGHSPVYMYIVYKGKIFTIFPVSLITINHLT